MEKERALEILRALTDGVDPFTGEVYPEDSPYQKADTVRAMSLAVHRLEKWRLKDLPARAGMRWSEEEDAQLAIACQAGRAITDIAREHERTKEAIVSRMIRLQLVEPLYRPTHD